MIAFDVVCLLARKLGFGPVSLKVVSLSLYILGCLSMFHSSISRPGHCPHGLLLLCFFWFVLGIAHTVCWRVAMWNNV